jgi:chorismate dehydratase
MNPFDTSAEPLRFRVGAVNYLNSKPLVFGFDEAAADAKLLFDLPSRLADALSEGRFDVALIPTVEFLRQPAYRILSNACVASDGPVLSVKVYFRTPPDQVKRIALDEGSRTSVALARVLLAERAGVQPELGCLPIGYGVSDCDSDAVLLIGDRAMHAPKEHFVEAWDLGEEWRLLTGLPFVFALWAARPQRRLDRVEAALERARDLGVLNFAKIAQQQAPALGITVEAAQRYLTDNLHYQLGEREFAALTEFQTRCRKWGILPPLSAPIARYERQPLHHGTA